MFEKSTVNRDIILFLCFCIFWVPFSTYLKLELQQECVKLITASVDQRYYHIDQYCADQVAWYWNACGDVLTLFDSSESVKKQCVEHILTPSLTDVQRLAMFVHYCIKGLACMLSMTLLSLALIILSRTIVPAENMI